MSLHPLYLFLAIALLFTPISLPLGEQRRHFLRHKSHEVLLTLPNLLGSPWNWVELIRSAVGTWILCYLALPGPNAGPPALVASPEAILSAALLVSAVVIQVFVTGSRRLRLNPMFYLLGMSAAILPWSAALFGGMLAIVFTGMMRRWKLFYLFLVPCLLGASLVFETAPTTIGFMSLLLLPPTITSCFSRMALPVFSPIKWLSKRKSKRRLYAFDPVHDVTEKRERREQRRQTVNR
jgi:hypothetical protein